MAIKWTEGRYGFDNAKVGPFEIAVGWASSADKFGIEIPAIGIRIKGFDSMDVAKARAEVELRKALTAALRVLGPAAPEVGG